MGGESQVFLKKTKYSINFCGVRCFNTAATRMEEALLSIWPLMQANIGWSNFGGVVTI